MWFRQIQLFELTSPIGYQPERLNEDLQAFTLQPCLPSLPMALGWAPPAQLPDAPLVYAADGYILISLGISEKILPSQVVKQTLQDKIKAVEARDGRSVGRKQRQALQEEIFHTLLPQAFVKTSYLYACIDTRHQQLWLSTTSARTTEHFILAWQKVMPEVGLVKPETCNIGKLLSHWLKNNSPKEFVIEKHAVLQDVQQKNRVIRCQQQDLHANSIQALLNDGCEVRQLGLCWQDRLNFVLDEQLQLKSLRCSDDVIERKDSSLSETPELRFATDFALLTANVTELFADLLPLVVKEKEGSKKQIKVTENVEEEALEPVMV